MKPTSKIRMNGKEAYAKEFTLSMEIQGAHDDQILSISSTILEIGIRDVSKKALLDFKYSVMCCQHDYEPKQGVKFRGAKNEKFPKKNWSSMMLMNNGLCTALTPEYVNSASGLELHQFKWLPNEHACGNIPLEWNWLVGEYEYNNNAKNVHYTLGGPYFNDYKDCDYFGSPLSKS